MKITKWYSTRIFVDQQTGEILTAEEAAKNYIYEKKHKKTKYEQEYNRKSFNIETIGIIEYTIECTRAGKQLRLID